MTVKIIRGDCREVLRTLPAESVHVCVTSPPYWGLRDYRVPASIWGGQDDCEHEWGATVIERATNHTDKRRWQDTRNGRDEEQPTEKRVGWLRSDIPQGQFCQHCGAWSGAHGLEPSYELFVANEVLIFREVRRVLRADGSLWLNLGDSYATGAGKVGDRPGGGAQGDAWGGHRGSRGGSAKQPHTGNAIGPMTQPNRMPQVGLKPKDLCGIPWRVAFALQADGWWLRSEIIWHKPSPMPESVTDRPTKAHEQVFLLTKNARYFWDADAVKEKAEGISGWAKQRNAGVNTWEYNNTDARIMQTGQRTDASTFGTAGYRNLRSVWTIASQPFSGSHFATMPPKLAETCIKAGTSERGCCPACGAPWVRSVNVTYDNPGNRTTNGPRSVTNRDFTAGFAVRIEKRTETTGWRPSCDCPPADPVPCTVLDPFSGAGTTGLVADRLGRDAILIELNEAYADMAAQRLRGDGGMFASVDLVHADEPMVPAITE